MPTTDQKLPRVFKALLSVAHIDHGEEFLVATGRYAPRITISGTITLDTEHYNAVMEELERQNYVRSDREAPDTKESP